MGMWGWIGAVIGVVAAVFTGGASLLVTAAMVAGGAAVGYMVGTTIDMILNPPSFDMPNTSNAAADAANNGVTVNKQGTNLSIPVVYGTRRLGGLRVFVSTNGSENKYLYMALVLAEGEINAIKKIYIDDALVWEGTTVHQTTYTPNVASSTIGGKYKNYFTFQANHGTTTQTAAPLLLEATGWGANKKLSGLAYLAVKCEWPLIKTNDDAKANPWKGLPNIVVELQGRIVKTSTNNAVSYKNLSYENRQSFSNYFTTSAFSDHPVECILDYLTNSTFGKGLASTEIDWHSFYMAKQKWATDQSNSTSQIGTNVQHRTNAIIFTERTVMENIKTILLNMRSSLVYQDGKYRLVTADNNDQSSVYAVNSVSVMTVDEDDIIGGIRIEAESAEQKYNRIIVSYMGGFDGDNNITYEPAEYTWPEVDSALDAKYLAEDGGRRVETKITLEHVTNVTTASKIAQILLEKSRNRGKIVTFQGTARMFQLEVGDIITLSYDSLTISGKYRVKNINQNSDFTFQITLEEHDDVTYAYNPWPKQVKPYKRYYVGFNPSPTTPTDGLESWPSEMNRDVIAVKPPDDILTPNPDLPPRGYTIGPNYSKLGEGQTVTYTVYTQNVPDGTVLWWSNQGTTAAVDFTDGLNVGTVTINNNAGTFTRTLASDGSTEGEETIIMNLRTVSYLGTIVATAMTVVVLDTSATQTLPPPYVAQQPPPLPPVVPPYLLILTSRCRVITSGTYKGYAELFFSIPWQSNIIYYNQWEIHYQRVGTAQPTVWTRLTSANKFYGGITESTYIDPLIAYQSPTQNPAGWLFGAGYAFTFRLSVYDGINATPNVMYYMNYRTPSQTEVNGVIF